MIDLYSELRGKYHRGTIYPLPLCSSLAQDLGSSIRLWWSANKLDNQMLTPSGSLMQQPIDYLFLDDGRWRSLIRSTLCRSVMIKTLASSGRIWLERSSSHIYTSTYKGTPHLRVYSTPLKKTFESECNQRNAPKFSHVSCLMPRFEPLHFISLATYLRFTRYSTYGICMPQHEPRNYHAAV